MHTTAAEAVQSQAQVLRRQVIDLALSKSALNASTELISGLGASWDARPEALARLTRKAGHRHRAQRTFAGGEENLPLP
jgi:hypothetical protein